MIYKHYFIAVYDEEDYIMFTADTWSELANILKLGRKEVTWKFVNYFNNKADTFAFNGHRCKAYLIDLNDEEDEIGENRSKSVKSLKKTNTKTNGF